MIGKDIKLEDCDRYKYPHGALYIGKSDETFSCGFLELSPDRATNKITRSLPEHVKQISASSEIEMFDDNNRITIKRLNVGETFMIPTNTLHVHRNRGIHPSINYWEYQGNAIDLVNKMRTDGMMDEAHKKSPSTITPPKVLDIPLKPADCDVYQLPTGKIYVGQSTKDQSIGFLELKSGMALDKHSRPIVEKLKQIKGESQVEIYQDSNEIKISKLKPGDEFSIPANQFHIHFNKSSDTSLTFWQFDGDITSVIAQIRTDGIKI